MSGGYYDCIYLHVTDFGNIAGRIDILQQVVNDLINDENPYAKCQGFRIEKHILTPLIKACETWDNAPWLKDTLKALDWYQSGDYGREQFLDTMKENSVK